MSTVSLAPAAHSPAGTFLLCDPRYFGVEYVINPWMEGKLGSVVNSEAVAQWMALYRLLSETFGATVERIEPRPGLPDMVFTANGALVRNGVCVPARMNPVERQDEEPFYQAWFAERGFRLVELPKEIPFEGAGDALFGEDKNGAVVLFCASGFRSIPAAHPLLGAAFGVPTLSVRLVDPRYYHLDTCFCPLPYGNYLWYPPAFDADSQGIIEEAIPSDKRYAVSDADAADFACNAVSVGENAVVMNSASRALRDWLAQRGFTTYATPLTEFMKSGGSAKCLTLRIDQ